MNSKSELKRMCTIDPVLMAEKLHETQRKLEVAVKALKEIDSWQGKQICNSSVYELDDDDFGDLQYIVHEALAEIQKEEG